MAIIYIWREWNQIRVCFVHILFVTFSQWLIIICKYLRVHQHICIHYYCYHRHMCIVYNNTKKDSLHRNRATTLVEIITDIGVFVYLIGPAKRWIGIYVCKNARYIQCIFFLQCCISIIVVRFFCFFLFCFVFILAVEYLF